MKKQILFSLLAVIFSTSLFGQFPYKESSPGPEKMLSKVAHDITKTNKSSSDGGWYNYAYLADSIGLDMDWYWNSIHPDTTLISGYIDTDPTSSTFGDTVYYNNWSVARGQLLDPTSFYFVNPDFFAPGETYIFDSIV